MIDCFNARIGDGQTYVCTVYARNSKPRIATKQSFSLLGLFLRASQGSIVSTLYGRDEHARASGLFPENVMCVQGYVPLERPTRFISVFLKSPFATTADLYKTDVQHQNLRARDDQMLTTMRDVFFPMSSDQPQVANIRQQTSALIACIRRSYKVCVIGFVGEFVCDTEGRIYFHPPSVSTSRLTFQRQPSRVAATSCGKHQNRRDPKTRDDGSLRKQLGPVAPPPHHADAGLAGGPHSRLCAHFKSLNSGVLICDVTQIRASNIETQIMTSKIELVCKCVTIFCFYS
jgi:hypothetical protein